MPNSAHRNEAFSLCIAFLHLLSPTIQPILPQKTSSIISCKLAKSEDGLDSLIEADAGHSAFPISVIQPSQGKQECWERSFMGYDMEWTFLWFLPTHPCSFLWGQQLDFLLGSPSSPLHTVTVRMSIKISTFPGQSTDIRPDIVS